MEQKYRCFTRTWWKRNPSWPNGLEPCPGRKHTQARNLTYDEARDFCLRYNMRNSPGRLGKKCEFEAM